MSGDSTLPLASDDFQRLRSELISISDFQDAGCEDVYPTEMCEEHAAIKGYCDNNKEFMEKRCARSCGFCQRKFQ